MMKHILGQAFLQIAVLLFLIMDGENFIPEYHDSYDA